MITPRITRRSANAFALMIVACTLPSCRAIPALPAEGERISDTRITGPCKCKTSFHSDLLNVGAIALFGEMHGTNESPAFMGDLLCGIAERKLPVLLGLELPLEEQSRVDGFLNSEGTEEDRRALLAGPFWMRAYQDGRSSRAMLSLLERARTLRCAGADINVTLFDHDNDGPDGQTRDQMMAANLANAFSRHPNSVCVVLTGNVHAWTKKGAPWDPSFLPMGYILKQRHLRVVSLDVSFPPGDAWICTGDSASTCGPMPQPRGSRSGVLRQAAAIETFKQPTAEGVDGVFRVSTTTASPPALNPTPATATRTNAP